ncbi:MAG: hypothetical protein ACXVRG_12580 [Gaiellaceae bacterium]
MSSLRVDYERAAPVGAALGSADEFVAFWQAGAVAGGQFCCVACGRRLVSARVLPPCPTCDGRLCEKLATSPFGTVGGSNVAAYEALSRDEPDRGRFLRGLGVALVVGPAIWLALAGIAFAAFELLRG